MDTFPGCNVINGSFDLDLELKSVISGSAVAVVASPLECSVDGTLFLYDGTDVIHAFVTDVSAQTVRVDDTRNFIIAAGRDCNGAE